MISRFDLPEDFFGRHAAASLAAKKPLGLMFAVVSVDAKLAHKMLFNATLLAYF